MSAHLAIAAAAGLAALAAVKPKARGSQSQGLSMGTNDLGWALIDVGPVAEEYPGAPFRFRDHLALVEIETRVRGRFWEAMRLVEDFARSRGYAGVFLRAEAQSAAVDQEALEGLYRRAGYAELPSGSVDDYDDEDVFFVKNFSQP
jgi:hypothetical protein